MDALLAQLQRGYNDHSFRLCNCVVDNPAQGRRHPLCSCLLSVANLRIIVETKLAPWNRVPNVACLEKSRGPNVKQKQHRVRRQGGEDPDGSHSDYSDSSLDENEKLEACTHTRTHYVVLEHD
jgi:hypothetical protein